MEVGVKVKRNLVKRRLHLMFCYMKIKAIVIGVFQSRIPKRKAVPKARITQVFEPAVLELAGITDEAERIRLSDMPERYAMRSFPITPPGAELPEEARWIYNKLFSEREYRYAKKRRPAEPGKTKHNYSKL